MKLWSKIFHANSNKKTGEVAIFILDKLTLNLKKNEIKWDAIYMYI